MLYIKRTLLLLLDLFCIATGIELWMSGSLKAKTVLFQLQLKLNGTWSGKRRWKNTVLNITFQWDQIELIFMSMYTLTL